MKEFLKRHKFLAYWLTAMVATVAIFVMGGAIMGAFWLLGQFNDLFGSYSHVLAAIEVFLGLTALVAFAVWVDD